MSDTETKVTIGALILGWILTAIGWVWRGASVSERIRKNDEDHRKMLEDHEHRLRALEAQASAIAEMRNDMRWVKQVLEDIQKSLRNQKSR